VERGAEANALKVHAHVTSVSINKPIAKDQESRLSAFLAKIARGIGNGSRLMAKNIWQRQLGFFEALLIFVSVKMAK